MVAAVLHKQALEFERFHRGRFVGKNKANVLPHGTVRRLFGEDTRVSARADAFGKGPCGRGFPAAVNALEGDEEASGWECRGDGA